MGGRGRFGFEIPGKHGRKHGGGFGIGCADPPARDTGKHGGNSDKGGKGGACRLAGGKGGNGRRILAGKRDRRDAIEPSVAAASPIKAQAAGGGFGGHGRQGNGKPSGGRAAESFNAIKRGKHGGISDKGKGRGSTAASGATLAAANRFRRGCCGKVGEIKGSRMLGIGATGKPIGPGVISGRFRGGDRFGGIAKGKHGGQAIKGRGSAAETIGGGDETASGKGGNTAEHDPYMLAGRGRYDHAGKRDRQGSGKGGENTIGGCGEHGGQAIKAGRFARWGNHARRRSPINRPGDGFPIGRLVGRFRPLATVWANRSRKGKETGARANHTGGRSVNRSKQSARIAAAGQ